MVKVKFGKMTVKEVLVIGKMGENKCWCTALQDVNNPTRARNKERGSGAMVGAAAFCRTPDAKLVAKVAAKRDIPCGGKTSPGGTNVGTVWYMKSGVKWEKLGAPRGWKTRKQGGTRESGSTQQDVQT